MDILPQWVTKELVHKMLMNLKDIVLKKIFMELMMRLFVLGFHV